MAKYIIDIPEETIYLNALERKDGKVVWAKSYDISDLRPYTASESYIDGLKRGQNEAWEFAWEVLQLDLPVFREIFGYDTDKMDYRDYKYKYEAWKKQKDEIRVGDEVEICGTIGIVTRVPYLDEERVHYIAKSGTVYCNNSYAEIKKTGRHFDEIEELLKKMREE